MAKKKTTTTRKTKTTAKKASAAVKAVTKKTAVSPLVAKTRALHQLNIVLQLILAGMVLFIMKPVFYALSLGFVSKDALLSESETVFVPAEKVLVDFDIRWLLITLIATSAVYSILVVSRWRASYERAQAGRVYLWRWVFLAIASAVMVKFVSIVGGVEDIATLKMAGGLMAGAMVFAWLSERAHETAGQTGQAPFWLSLASGLLAMYAIFVSFIGTTLFGMIRLPWYVYALDAVLLIGFLLVLMNLSRSNKKMRRANDYAAVERNYVVITMLSQLLFVAIALAGLSA